MITSIREGSRQIHIYKGPRGHAYQCPHCGHGETLFKPISWGETAKARARLGRHILANHADKKPIIQGRRS